MWPLRNRIWRQVSSRLCEQSLIDIWIVAISNLNFHKELSTFGYSNTNETVYFIEITGITDATGESKRNLNTKEKIQHVLARVTPHKLNFGSQFIDRLPRFFAKNLQLMFQFSFLVFTDATVVVFSPKKAS